MCVRKPVISLRWRKQKEGGYKGASEGKECADRKEDKLDMPCCSFDLCVWCTSGREHTCLCLTGSFKD